MTAFRLALAYLRWRPLSAVLNVVLMALGVATLVLLLLFGHQLEQRVQRDAGDVDLVVGAPGSPLQLILSSVFHADIPTGNIALDAAERIAEHRQVAEAIPLALGDQFRGFRIVGTDLAYPALYGAEVADGRMWDGSMEAVLGARTAEVIGRGVGSRFVGAHGLDAGGGGHTHDYAPYKVVGVLAPTGTVLDRLILTSVESVWDVHAEPDGHEHDAEHHGHEAEDATPETPQDAFEAERAEAEAAGDEELTALLVRYASPMAALQLPREINRQAGLQAASPAFETARLMQLLGTGFDAVRAFGAVLLGAAGLALFVGLYNALRERRGDLAVLRALGAPPGTVCAVLLIEGVVSACVGAALGLILGHGAAEWIGTWVADARGVPLTGWIWLPGELWLIAGAGAIGALAALIPAIAAYRVEVARALQS